MPSTVVAYVNTASSGGDGTTNNTSGGTAAYSNLNAAVAGRAADLVSADQILNIKCSGSAADTTSLAQASWAGYVMDATRYVLVEPNTGQEHGGKWNTGVYRLQVSDLSPFGGAVAAGAAYAIKVQGLQVKGIATTGSTSRRCFNFAAGITIASTVDIWNCIIWMDKTGGTATSHGLTEFADGQWTVKMHNCLGIIQGSSVGAGFRRNAAINMYVHNCGLISPDGGADIAYYDVVNSSSGTYQVKNCWAKGFNSSFSSGLGIENGDYNSTDLSAATGDGGNERVSQTFTFVDAANGDYRPTSADTAIKGRGVDLSGDANLPVSTDMKGTAHNSPPEIGPLNFFASGVNAGKIRIIRAP